MMSQELKISVLRKDDIYDMLSVKDLEHSIKNRLSYNIMAKNINTNLRNNCDIIIDIALANSDHFSEFLSNLDLQGSHVIKFLCICSIEEVWRKRMEERIKNPTPNQLFKTVDEAVRYYTRYDIAPAKEEIIIDSSQSLPEILEKIKSEL